MKRLTRALAIALAATFGLVAFTPPESDAHPRLHRHRHRAVLRPVVRPLVHVQVRRDHGPVTFAYEDGDGRAVYSDRKGYFYFGPKGGHIHFER